MKKYLILTLLAIFIGLIIPYKAHSMDITVGATMWSPWMDRYQKVISGETVQGRYDQTLLYGPAMSVKFNDDFNLTFIYLYGKFNEASMITIKRKDSDLALNYRLSDYFKVFGGLKYMGFEEEIKSMSLGIPSDTIKHKGYGPGLGLSSTLPVTENVYILATLSGFYLWGKESGTYNSTPFDSKYTEYGINATISIGYYIVPASTTISVGQRYQYIKTSYNNDKPFGDPDAMPYFNKKHKFYGTTLTATYSFSI